MFNIAVDEWGKTYNAEELVEDKTEAEVGSAKKRKYFCVACVGEKHPVSLNVRHTMASIDPRRNYTALAWFSHHGGGGLGNWGHDNHRPETAKHWQAKHILSQHAARCCFVTSKCTSCVNHTKTENGLGATGKVEFTEMTADGTKYVFDVVLVRGEPGSRIISSVLEVWATHETHDKKRQYCLDQGYSFAEFHADHVLEAHKNAPHSSVFNLENLKIRCFECDDCAHARKQTAIQNEKLKLAAIALAEKAQILKEQARLLEITIKEQREKRELQIEADKKFQEEREKKEEMKRILDEVKNKTLADNILQANYNQWVILQSDNLKKRKERDEQSHQRWIRARSDLQNKHKVA
jgi:hypothetical protein